MMLFTPWIGGFETCTLKPGVEAKGKRKKKISMAFCATFQRGEAEIGPATVLAAGFLNVFMSGSLCSSADQRQRLFFQC